MGGASVRAAVAAGDAKGAHSDGGDCCPSSRTLLNVITIVMAVHSVTAGRVQAVRTDWLLPLVRSFIASVLLSQFHSLFLLSSVLHLSSFVL